MSLLFLHYPGCSTCQKARKWLEARGIPFDARHIVESPPTVEELTSWIALGNLSVDQLFNTNGMSYRALGLNKDKLAAMPLFDKLALLAADGKLVKRPLLVASNQVLVGFREAEWADYFAASIK